jgi:uroporphyrinogen III methyltransferase / synthase
MEKHRMGRVYLVGAGPGDPGLITVKGRECIARADVLIYDYLANPVFLSYAREGAERIYVGKKAGQHTVPQEGINALIVERANRGRTVVRLKGGDPFIFGRGGEEAEELVQAGVPFEVVPGVTSAIAVPAYAGIPLTHRDYTATLAFITGHEDPGKRESNIAWDKLATGAGTLVFLMGVGNLYAIAERLMDNGRDPATPVAVIRRGTGPDQQTLVGILENIAELAEESGMKPPAIIVVGEVVRLREKLEWFEKRPLFGRRIVVTRAREQASGFLERLSQLGAACIEFPTIEVVPPESFEPMDSAIKQLSQYDWLLFTSVNGVKYFLQRLHGLGRDVRDLKGVKLGAIGPGTAGAWSEMGIRPDLVPGEYRAEAVVKGLGEFGIRGKKILLPRAVKAREVLPLELRKMGAEVDVVPAYRTVRPSDDVERVKGMLERNEVHMVTFTSSSTVTNFVEMFGSWKEALREKMSSVASACIGPITAKTVEGYGFSVDLIPSEYTIDALTEEIVAYFSR